MKWITVNNYDEMSQYGTKRLFTVIASKINAGQKVNIGLATGNTMIKLYAMLAEMLNQSGLRLENLSSFNLDEYVGNDGANLAPDSSLELS